MSRWELVSSTGQVRRNWRDGWIVIDSDYGQVIMGDLSKAPATRFLAVKGKPQFGVVAVVPLERKPLTEAMAFGCGRESRQQRLRSSLQRSNWRLSPQRRSVEDWSRTCGLRAFTNIGDFVKFRDERSSCHSLDTTVDLQKRNQSDLC